MCRYFGQMVRVFFYCCAYTWTPRVHATVMCRYFGQMVRVFFYYCAYTWSPAEGLKKNRYGTHQTHGA